MTARNAMLGPNAVPRLLPSGGVVPANLLRLHVAFASLPDMEAVATSARLLNEAGDAVPHAFLDLPGGLWSADGRVLTLLMHPGRIKSGLGAHDAWGQAVTAGRRYDVEISDGGRAHRFQLIVGAPVTSALDPGLWPIETPEPRSRRAITITFDRPMDWLCAPSGLAVLDGADSVVAGQWSAAKDGRSAAFTPDKPWTTVHVAIAVSADFEDVAGNRVSSAFELAMHASVG